MSNIEIDISKKINKLSYNAKDLETITIKGLEGSFLDKITKVTALGNTLSINISSMKKPLTFTNISNPSEINLIATDIYNTELYNQTLSAFYFEDKFGNSDKNWLSKKSSTKVTGTVFSETIDLSGEDVYVPKKSNAKRKIGVTINANGGDDTIIGTDYKDSILTGEGQDYITSGYEADTITIDGNGKKTIYIKKGDGNDTIIFKGQGLNAETILAFDYNQNNPNFVNWDFEKSKNNLLIKRNWLDENGIVEETTTIKDYFKYNLDIKIKKDNTENYYELSDFITGGKQIIIDGSPKGANTLIGTEYADIITGGKKSDKITTGSGNDLIIANGGADKITINGAGNKTITIGRNDGNDTIIFDLKNITIDENINVNLFYDYLYGSAPEITYKVASNKQDLIITNKYFTIIEEVFDDPDWKGPVVYKGLTQTITLKNYFLYADKINLTVDNNENVYETLKTSLGEVIGTQGTSFDDEIDASNINNLTKTVKIGSSKQIVPKETSDKGLTISGGYGNDIITGTMYSDIIIGGAGKNIVVVNPNLYKDANDNIIGFGNDIIKLTKDENLVVDLTAYYNDINEADIISLKENLSISGNDLILTLPDGTINFENFAKTNVVGENGSVKLWLGGALNDENSEISINLNNERNLLTRSTLTKRVISGTRFSDKIIAGSGNHKLTGGIGADTFVVSSENNGIVTISDATQEDNIIISDACNYKLAKNKNNLEILYINENEETNDNNKVVIQNYFKITENNRINNLILGENENPDIISLSDEVDKMMTTTDKQTEQYNLQSSMLFSTNEINSNIQGWLTSNNSDYDANNYECIDIQNTNPTLLEIPANYYNIYSS